MSGRPGQVPDLGTATSRSPPTWSSGVESDAEAVTDLWADGASTNSRSRRRSRSSAPEANARRPRSVSCSARRGFSPPKHPSQPRRSPTGPRGPTVAVDELGRTARAPRSRRRRRRRAGRRGGGTRRRRRRSSTTGRRTTVTVDEIKRLPNRWTCSATPCGPLASTTRSTSTTTSPPASATTGRDSTAARGQTPAATRRRGCRARRHRRSRGRPPTAAATGLATTDHCGRTSEDLGDSRDGVPLPNGGRVNTLRHQPNRRASRTDYEAAVHCVAGEEHDQHAHFPPRSRASEIRRRLNQIPA